MRKASVCLYKVRRLRWTARSRPLDGIAWRRALRSSLHRAVPSMMQAAGGVRRRMRAIGPVMHAVRRESFATVRPGCCAGYRMLEVLRR